jgi:hypothetical protein
LKNPVTDTVVYTPKRKVIRDKLKNLEDFIHAEDDLDPLVKMAIIHYHLKQFTLSLMEMDERGELFIAISKMTGLLDLPAFIS